MEAEVKDLKKQGITTIVSLLENHEIRELSIDGFDKECLKQAVNHIHYPMEDRAIPDSILQFDAFAKSLKERIDNDEKLLVHCRMGIGRSSMISAAILLNFDAKLQDVFSFISEKRELSVPDVMTQKDFIERYQEKLLRTPF